MTAERPVRPDEPDVPDADVPDADVPDADVPDADVPDAYVEAHIQDALAQDERVGELGVEVTLTPGGVFLTGEVASPERQAAIAEVVGEVVPDREVHNQTEVMEYPEPDGAEQMGPVGS